MKVSWLRRIGKPQLLPPLWVILASQLRPCGPEAIILWCTVQGVWENYRKSVCKQSFFQHKTHSAGQVSCYFYFYCMLFYIFTILLPYARGLQRQFHWLTCECPMIIKNSWISWISWILNANRKNIDQRVTARFGICANKMLLLVIPVRKTNVTEHFVNIVSCRDIEAHYFKRVAITVSAIIKAPFPPLRDYCTVS